MDAGDEGFGMGFSHQEELRYTDVLKFRVRCL